MASSATTSETGTMKDDAASLEEFLDQESARDALRRALRRIDELKRSRADLIQATRDAVRDAVASMSIPAVKAPGKDKRKGQGETAIAVLSDWQVGKRTPTYNSDVCARRIEEYAQKVERLTAVQRAEHPVRELRVYLLGDIVEGEMVFPGQAHQIDASLFRQIMLGGEIIANFVRRMAASFDRVRVVGVTGNHGIGPRLFRKELHPDTVADAFVYETARRILERERRVECVEPIRNGERIWHAVDRVGDKAFMLFHGNQIRGHSGIPWYGITKKVHGWRNGGVSEPFDYALFGHFHQALSVPIGRVVCWCNGSPESDNVHAQEELAAMSTPQQWLLFAHPKLGVTAEYRVHLT
jgi:predicted phosphodiesterase